MGAGAASTPERYSAEMPRCTIVAIAAAFALVSDALHAQSTEQPLALVATYADGRITESPIGPDERRAWTPMFPRVAGWREPAGVLPVRALNTRVARVGTGLRVVVSVLRGRQTNETEEAIGTFDVLEHQPVTVEALRRVGLLPVTYSVKPFATPALETIPGSSRVDGLTVDGIEPLVDPVPAYRISVRNHTDVPLVSFAINSYRGGIDALSGQQGHPAALPIAAPGETYTFTLKLSGGRSGNQPFATVAPLDHVVVTGGLWADGHTSGDPKRAGMLAAIQRGRLRALDAVGLAFDEILAPGDRGSIAAVRRLRATLAALPSAFDATAVAREILAAPSVAALRPTDAAATMAVGTENVRRQLLADIDRVVDSATPAQAQQWMREARAACDAWRTRLQALFPAR